MCCVFLCEPTAGGAGGEGLPAEAEWTERWKGWPQTWRRVPLPGSPEPPITLILCSQDLPAELGLNRRGRPCDVLQYGLVFCILLCLRPAPAPNDPNRDDTTRHNAADRCHDRRARRGPQPRLLNLMHSRPHLGEPPAGGGGRGGCPRKRSGRRCGRAGRKRGGAFPSLAAPCSRIVARR